LALASPAFSFLDFAPASALFKLAATPNLFARSRASSTSKLSALVGKASRLVIGFDAYDDALALFDLVEGGGQSCRERQDAENANRTKAEQTHRRYTFLGAK
jgi:hypothetical protein